MIVIARLKWCLCPCEMLGCERGWLGWPFLFFVCFWVGNKCLGKGWHDGLNGIDDAEQGHRVRVEASSVNGFECSRETCVTFDQSLNSIQRFRCLLLKV